MSLVDEGHALKKVTNNCTVCSFIDSQPRGDDPAPYGPSEWEAYIACDESVPIIWSVMRKHGFDSKTDGAIRTHRKPGHRR